MARPKRPKRGGASSRGVNGNTATSVTPSEAEVWDDSALIRSWDDALKEYEYYHSIHARGEDVEKILREAEAEAELADDGAIQKDFSVNPGEWQSVGNHGARDDKNAAANDDDDLEDGEVDDDDDDMELGQVQNAAAAAAAAPGKASLDESQAPDTQPTVPNPPIGPQLPSRNAQVHDDTVQDQTLENIKMAYYWAGYYSGLYDGQRQARQ